MSFKSSSVIFSACLAVTEFSRSQFRFEMGSLSPRAYLPYMVGHWPMTSMKEKPLCWRPFLIELMSYTLCAVVHLLM